MGDAESAKDGVVKSCRPVEIENPERAKLRWRDNATSIFSDRLDFAGLTRGWRVIAMTRLRPCSRSHPMSTSEQSRRGGTAKRWSRAMTEKRL